jgi:hypothetical protein
MNVKKIMKKINTVAMSTLVLGSTILGASAYDLSDYPAPFVEDGVADVTFVIGSGSTDDYLGALDIATNLQSRAVTTTKIESSDKNEFSSEGSVQIEGQGSETHLAFGELIDFETFDEDDLPVLLKDGSLIDEDGDYFIGSNSFSLDEDEWDYEQEIVLYNQPVSFGMPEDEENPVIYLNQYINDTYTVSVQFDDEANFSALDDGESIEIAGKVFTVGSKSNADTLTLFGSKTTTFLELGVPVVMEQDGQEYEITLVGAQAEDNDDSLIIEVDGERKNVEEGEIVTINGLELYVKDVFVTNIPSLDASANVFIGSEEYEISKSGSIKVSGEKLDGYSVDLGGATFDNVSTMNFTLDVSDLSDDNGYTDEDKYLKVGESLVDPLFGTFSMQFAGMSEDFASESKSYIEIEAGSDEVSFVLTNTDGEEVSFTALELDENDDSEWHEDFIKGTNKDAYEGSIFIGHDGSDRSSVFEVTDIDASSATPTVSILDLGSGNEKEYEQGDIIKDTQLEIGAITDNVSGDDYFQLVGTALNTFEIEGKSVLFFNKNKVTLTEGITGADEAISASILGFSLNVDGDEYEIKYSAGNTTLEGVKEENEDDETIIYTEFGTYGVLDEDGDSLELFVPEDEEVGYSVFIAPTGVESELVDSDLETQEINPIALGIAMRDKDVNLANPSSNLIVIGGSCINTVSAELLGVVAGTCGTESGINPNEAVIQLFDDLDNGKVALLVAGWESSETIAGARALITEELEGDRVVIEAQ